MRRILAAAAVALLVAGRASSRPPEAEQHESPAAQHQSDRADVARRGEQSRPFPLPDGCAACEEIAKHIQSDPPEKWWQRGWAWGWAAVVAAAVYSVVAWRQLAAIRRQAKIAESALTDLERPWVVVEMVAFNANDELLKGLVASDADAETIRRTRERFTMLAQFKYTNCGRSPAWITKRVVVLDTFRNPFPTVPNYDYGSDPPTMLGPGADLHDSRGGEFSSLVYGPMLTGEAVLTLYGKVEYRDAFGKTHESCWCLVYDVPRKRAVDWWSGWDVGGPESWTRYT